MSEQTFYPGIGADEEIARLHHAVGEITGFLAQIEDGLFHLFVVAIAGKWLVGDIRPDRAVFFTPTTYNPKRQMVDNAMKARFGDNEEIMAEWTELKKALNGAVEIRNRVAHLVPMAKTSTDPNAKATVRLVPAFWKQTSQSKEFDELGLSLEELLHAFAPYRGYHLQYWTPDMPRHQLGYQLQQFALKLSPPRPPQSTHPKES
jgi:hypothetical protein